MTTQQYIESKQRELDFYREEVKFQNTLSTDSSTALWLSASQRVAFLEKEIDVLKRHILLE